MKNIRYLGSLFALLCTTLLPIQAEETAPPEPPEPAEETTSTPLPFSTEEIDTLLNQPDYSTLEALLQDPEIQARWDVTPLSVEQSSLLLHLYRTESIELSKEDASFSQVTRSDTRRKARKIGSYNQLVQSSAFILGDQVPDSALKYVYNGDGTNGDAVMQCGINERSPQVNGDFRFRVNDDSTLWIPQIGTWYGEPVGMAVRLIRNVNGINSSQALMLQPNDWGTNIYYEDITDVTNTIRLYKNVDLNNPHVNGQQINFDTNYAIFAGSHGLTDEDASWDGKHYRSSEASGPVDTNMDVYTDHLDWIAEGKSATGKTMYYANEYRKTIRVSFDVSGRQDASFYLGVVNRGGINEPTQDGGFDFNGWNNAVEHATFVVVDPNGGSYKGSADQTHHEGMPNDTVQIEDSIRPGYVFLGYELTQPLGTWDSMTKTYTYGTPEENGIRYGILQAQWKKIELQWKIEKKVDLLQANLGDELTYTLTISSPTDLSAAQADHMTITDKLPAGTSFISASEGGTYENDQITWQFDRVLTSQQKSLSFKAKVLESAHQEIPNQALLKTTFGNDTQEITSNEVVTTLLPANLKLIKHADRAKADLNDRITYTITIKNTGTGTAKNYVIQDTVPNGTAYVSGGTYHNTNNTVTFEGTSLKPNEEKTFSFTVQVKEDAPDTIKNTAIVHGEDGPGTIPDIPSNTIETLLLQPQITIIKTSLPTEADGVDIDETIEWQLTITNQGEGTARHVLIKDPVPAGTDYIPDSATDNEIQGIHSFEQNGVVYWALDLLKPNESRTVCFKSKVQHDTEADEIINTASWLVTRQHPEDWTTIQTEQNTNTVRLPLKQPQVTVQKSSNPETGSYVSTNQLITYNLTATNTGSGTAGWTVVTDEIPVHTAFVSAEQNGVFHKEKNRVEWRIHDLKPNESITLSFTVKVDPDTIGKTIENVALYNTYRRMPSEPGMFDHDLITQTNKTIHQVGQPAVEILKTANPKNGNTVHQGSVIEYTLTVKNTGTGTAHYIPIRDTLPIGTEVVSETGFTGNYRGTYLSGPKAVEWLVTELLPGQEETLKLKVKVHVSQGELLNQALYTVKEEDPGIPGTWKTKLLDKSNVVRHHVGTRQAVVTTAVKNFPHLLTTGAVLTLLGILFTLQKKRS